MIKSKKVLLGTIAGMSAVAAPLATVISCGNSKVSNKVLIKTGWSKTGPQYRAFQQVVDRYNKTNPKFKVILQSMEGGYGKVGPTDLRDVKLKHFDTVSDLFIDYPDAAGLIAASGVELDFASLGPNSIQRSDFEKKFMGVNDRIGGIQKSHNKPGKSIYAAPIAASTEMLSGDLPALKIALANIAKAGGKVKGLKSDGTVDPAVKIKEGSLLSQIIKYTATDDDATVRSLWGTDEAFLKAANSANVSKLNIDETTFEDYTKIVEFSTAIQKAYGKTAKSDVYVLGLDAPTNQIFQAIASVNDYDMDKFFYQKNEYKKWMKDGKEKEAIIKALKIFQPGINSGAVKFHGGGVFTSLDLVEHSAMISWGSTAGYSHNYKSVIRKFTFGAQKLNEHTYPIVNQYSYKGVQKTLADFKGAIGFKHSGRHYNKIYPNTFKGIVGKYDTKLDKVGTDWLLKQKADSKHQLGWISNTTNVMVADANKATKFIDHNKNTGALIATSEVRVTTPHNDSKTIQRSEVGFSFAPSTVDSETKHTVMVQGPSLIGIKHGGQKDIETGKFVKWFFTTKDKMDLKQGSSIIKLSPIEYFDKFAGYITPIAGAFNPGNEKKYWNGNLFSYKAFEEMVSNPNYFGFQAPVNKKSSALRRNVFDSALRDSWSIPQHAKPNEPISAEKIYAQLVINFTPLI